ncbi:MAG: prolyl oligopeptidase family serine peptidase [Vicinamibacterales bacterium]
MRIPSIARAAALALLVAALPQARPAAQAQRPMTIADTVEVPILADPQVAPDGRRVAFMLVRADWAINRLMPQVFVTAMDGSGEPVQLTFDRRGASSPRWSPDGRTLAFVARRDGDPAGQIYLLPMDGSGGEARRLGTLPSSPGALRWAPDGSALYFLASDPPTAVERTRQRVQDDVYEFDADWKPRRLWRIDLAGTATALTPADTTVLEYTLSADGARVAHRRAPSPLLDDSAKGEVWIMAADGTGAVQVTDNAVEEHEVRFSPDGSRLLFLAEVNSALEPYYNAKVFTMAASGGPLTRLEPDAPYEVDSAEWSADGRRIRFVANLGVHQELMDMAAAGGDVRTLTSGDHAVGNWRQYAGGDVFTLNEPTRVELWRLETGAAAPVPVTHLHRYVAETFALARQEKVTWTGRDGVTIEGLLNYPIDYEPGRRYPLVVSLHGGPSLTDQFGGMNNPFTYLEVLAGRGYAVLRPNYRGSSAYGDAFRRDIVGDYFRNQPYDVLAGVDHVIEMGVADPARLIVMGGSAGGHLTNKLITMTDRFKAAISTSGAANWISLFAQTDSREDRDVVLEGTPWQADAPFGALWAQSPLSTVWKASTPTLLIVGERDRRVPMPQSVEMYRGLKANGVPVRLLVGPREAHSWGELRHVLSQAAEGLWWMEHYALGREYERERAPGDEKGTNGQR